MPDGTPGLKPGTKIIIAALVPSCGDEDRPLVAAVVEAVTATGAVVVGTIIQRRGISRSKKPGGKQARAERRALSPTTFLGAGKAAELAELVRSMQAEAVVFCNPLTGTQQRNLAAAVGATVLWYRPEENRTDSYSS